MPLAVYYSWDKLGRPLEPARPIREVVERLRVAYPRAAEAHLFSWYADEAHYQAEPPQDHTPFSATGWPLESPRWVVFATDVMHRPDQGVDCFDLFPYWLYEAKAGRMPWLKYLIWQAKRYDLRNDYAPVDASGHFGHVHLSARTDHQHTSLGDWSVEGDTMITQVEADLIANTTVTNLLGRLLGASGPTVGVALQGTYKNVVTLLGRAGVELTPEQLAAVQAAAEKGVDLALDGATVTTTIDTGVPDGPGA